MRTARLCCTSFGRRSGSGCDAFRAFQRPVHLPVVEVMPRGTPAATPTQFPTIRRCTVPSWEQSLQASLEPILTKRAALRSVSSNPARGSGLGRLTPGLEHPANWQDHQIFCAPGIHLWLVGQTASRMRRAALATHFPCDCIHPRRSRFRNCSVTRSLSGSLNR